MLYFENDYCEGAHPAILQKLAETNFEKVPGYGTDPYCARAKAKICAACGCPDADVTFISGGTQTNAIVIASMLQRWQGVMAAATGHVAAHEAGAIEYTGHKVIALPAHVGKVSAADVRDWCATFYADANHDHMVFPGMVANVFCNFSMNSAFYMVTQQRVHLGGEKALFRAVFKPRFRWGNIKTLTRPENAL